MAATIPNQADGTPSLFLGEAKSSPNSSFPYCVIDGISCDRDFFTNTSTYRHMLLQLKVVSALAQDDALAMLDVIGENLAGYPIVLGPVYGFLYAIDRGKTVWKKDVGLNVWWAATEFRFRRTIDRTKTTF